MDPRRRFIGTLFKEWRFPVWQNTGVKTMLNSYFLVAIALLSLAPAGPLLGQDGEADPAVWMAPPSFDNGKCFRELFEHPDAWKETRSVIDVLMYADHQLDRQFSDDELRGW